MDEEALQQSQANVQALEKQHPVRDETRNISGKPQPRIQKLTQEVIANEAIKVMQGTNEVLIQVLGLGKPFS